MTDFFTAAFDDHERLLQDLRGHVAVLKSIAAAIISAYDRGNRLYLLGNGGSAADAQHIAAELVGRFRCDRRALPAVAITTDTSTLLSIGNDYGFERVFARQVEAHVRAGDVLWALSTSGGSENVIAAVESARKAGAHIVGFTGRTGGRLKPLCDTCFCVPHDQSDRIQEIHQIAYHLVCQAVETHVVGR